MNQEEIDAILNGASKSNQSNQVNQDEKKGEKKEVLSQDEVYDVGSPIIEEPKSEKKKKSGWVRKLTLTLVGILFFLVIIAVVWYIYDSKLATVTMIQPAEGTSVQGPVSGVKFTTDRKIFYEDLSTFVVVGSGGKEFPATLTMPNKGVKGTKGTKEFSWVPEVPLGAGEYIVTVDGDKIVRAKFRFKVFEVEKVEDTTTKDTAATTTTTGTGTTTVGDPNFLDTLNKAMQSKKEKEGGG